MSRSVLSVSSRAMIDACARLGLDTGAILEAARLDPATVRDPDARIPFEQVAALWQKAYELSGDPNLALHAIEVLPIGAYRVVDFLGMNAPTIGAALAKIAEYFPLINRVVCLRYEVGDKDVTFRVDAPSLPSGIPRPFAEYTLAAVFLRMRIVTSQAFRLERVEFSHPRPADISEHERIFDCPVMFGADACRMVIAREVWDMPRSPSDQAVFSMLDLHARRLMEQLPGAADVVGRVREAVEAALVGGDPTLESIARQLAMSPRTMQRRLREEGVVFNEVLNEMRFQAAQFYLADGGIAGAEVAYLLGFADQSAFNRAFKRWSGRTPTEYRNQTARRERAT